MLHSCLLVYFGSYENQLKVWLTSSGPSIATPIGPAFATPTHPALATPTHPALTTPSGLAIPTQRVITPSGKSEEAVDKIYSLINSLQ